MEYIIDHIDDEANLEGYVETVKNTIPQLPISKTQVKLKQYKHVCLKLTVILRMTIESIANIGK
jgi:hypothetical protein